MITGRAESGIGPGAGLPDARLPGHRPVRHAGQVKGGCCRPGSPPPWRGCCRRWWRLRPTALTISDFGVPPVIAVPACDTGVRGAPGEALTPRREKL